MKRFMSSICLLTIVSLLLLPQQIQAANSLANVSNLKVGFILSGSINDMGWNDVQNKGRLYLESKLGKSVSTVCIDNVPENSQVERIAEKLIAGDCKLIFATSYGYLESILRVAARHPDVVFMQVGRGNNLTKNVGG